MVKIDIDMPERCSDCVLNYDSIECMLSGTPFYIGDHDPYEERLPNCPLKEAKEIK